MSNFSSQTGILNGGVSVSTIRDGSEDLRLGDWYSTVNSTYSTFNGQMDEVRIWNVTRTQVEIQANMNSEISSATGLVASYNFNQGVANGNNAGVTTATDSSGNGNNGTLTNFALTGTTSNWVDGQTFGPTLTNDAPTTFAIGDTTVTWTATDAAGNTATCEQIITVQDNEAPTLSQNTALVDYVSNCDVAVPDLTGFATDVRLHAVGDKNQECSSHGVTSESRNIWY